MDVKPGEIVVVRHKDLLDRNHQRELYNIACKAFPDNKVIVLGQECIFEHYDKENFLEFLELARKAIEKE